MDLIFFILQNSIPMLIKRFGFQFIYSALPLPLLSLGTLTALTTLSFASSFIIRTPWVFLPIIEMSVDGTLMIIPFLLINITSSLSVTEHVETTFPFLSEHCILIAPEPPLLVSLYSEIKVLLP